MIVEYKYKNNKGKLQTITKNLSPACTSVETIYIGHKRYRIDKRELYLNEPKLVVWLKS
jgi:hypothetical protein